MKMMKKRAKMRKRKNHYFTKEHQDAIVEYAKTDDIKIRTKLYIMDINYMQLPLRVYHPSMIQ